jgi:large subunit ribosomal protein L23
MGLFNKFKKTDSEAEATESVQPEEKKAAEVPAEKKEEIKAEKPLLKAKAGKSKGKKDSMTSKVLIRPLVTEKVTDLASQGKYGFEVGRRSNKIEIMKAVENAYGVRPTKVSVINVAGKKVRYGKVSGTTKNWKKAIVTLKKGDKIEMFEGV